MLFGLLACGVFICMMARCKPHSAARLNRIRCGGHCHGHFKRLPACHYSMRRNAVWAPCLWGIHLYDGQVQTPLSGALEPHPLRWTLPWPFQALASSSLQHETQCCLGSLPVGYSSV